MIAKTIQANKLLKEASYAVWIELHFEGTEKAQEENYVVIKAEIWINL